MIKFAKPARNLKIMGLQKIITLILEESNLITIGLLIVILTIYTFHLHRLYSGIPPGPWGIPIFGYTLFLSSEPCKDFVKMSKKYGDIFTIGIGSNCCIVLNGYKVIKEGFANGVFHGRQSNCFTDDFGEKKMVGLMDGENWKRQRRFLLRALKDFAQDKDQLEHYIHKETEIAANVFLNANDQPCELNDLTYSIMANIICCFMLGHRFSDEDKYIVDALKALDHVINNFAFTSPVNALAGLAKYLPKKLTGIDVLFNSRQILYDFVDVLLKEHENTFDENHMRDLIDVYIMKLKATHGQDEIASEIYTKPYARANIALLFIAGTETSSSLMNWTLKILAAHPKVQKCLQDEMDSVVGFERHAIMNDLNQMPYTEAVLLEIQRYVSLIPATPAFHRVTDDITLNGYRIPKDIFVVANIWGVHYDPDLWENPEVFDPERFLDKDGVIAKLRDYVLPFSIGKRRCLGENLAKMTHFLVLTTLLQKFSFVLPKGVNWPFEMYLDMPIRKCLEYKMCAVERDDVMLSGYRIPKDSLVCANFWNVHYDPELWKNPEEFDPERFLDDNGIIGKLREYVMAFSIGKRRCLGEGLARIELFLVLTTIVQKFTFSLPGGEKWPFQVKMDVPVRKCSKSHICAVKRDNN